MRQKRYTAEEIIWHLRTIEIETGKGLAVMDACRKIGSRNKRIIGGRKNMAACAWIKRNG
jgi:hypothetical protein